MFFRTYLIIPLLLLVLFSCSDVEVKNDQEQQKKELPKALDGGDILDYSSYRRVSLINQIYEDLLSENQELRDLEKKLEDLSDNKLEIVAEFRSFFETNDLYYQEGLNLVNEISNDLLSQQADSLLVASQLKYSKKITLATSLMDEIDTLSVQINDYRILLKLIVTLPHIEEFQNQKHPSNSLLKKLIDEQKTLLLEEKDLIKNE
ncbi:MAG: hypothetical protein JXR11_02200 [Balneola sp.]